MVTKEKLTQHLQKAKQKLAETKKGKESKYDPEIRKQKKKVKRLARKTGKIVYMEKKLAEKQTKKKKGGE
ncbi:MAG: hypothetical protein HY579_00075 [Nitrospinae bacterium]|nr:hypothetical protein [Nitrospinota bacterium]MBI5427289.1 hypothetical protein [Nitrospinota bacterium]